MRTVPYTEATVGEWEIARQGALLAYTRTVTVNGKTRQQDIVGHGRGAEGKSLWYVPWLPGDFETLEQAQALCDAEVAVMEDQP
jgi:hypothetical protein